MQEYGVNTDDDLPLKKPLKFPTLKRIITCVLQKVEKLHKSANLFRQMFV